MIEAFGLVALFGDEGGASILSDSISKALITTAAGLVVAMPSIAVYFILKSRISNLGSANRDGNRKCGECHLFEQENRIAMRLPLDEEEKVDIQMSPPDRLCVSVAHILSGHNDDEEVGNADSLVASGDDFQLVDNPFGGKYGHYCRG